ncbi:MAG: T9SS type A sorting domain-containing protein [bacterium]
MKYTPSGKLEYLSDAEGNRIPDFSYAGYKNSSTSIPSVPVVHTISPLLGDNTSHIQTAIDIVGARPLDAFGLRGALFLNAGIYRVSGTLRINASGVVVRGAGDGSDTTRNTILLATGDSLLQTTVLIAGGGSDTKWSDKVRLTQTDITSDTILVGARSFTVVDASPYKEGDNIILYHPCSISWLEVVKFGETGSDAGWTIDQLPILYNRYIVAKNGNTITIDAPLFTTFIRTLSQSYIYKYSRSGLKTNIGLERFRIDINAKGVTTDSNGDERNHAWDAIRFIQIEDSWILKCTALHFGQSGFKTSTATRITIDSCSALEPISIITGERRYNFNLYVASQLILFKNCMATYGRHDFVSNGTSSVSGCVFTNCTSEFTYASSEGHRQWSQGLLYDKITFKNPNPKTSTVLGLYNRGDYGTGHGWASVHSVAWNCSAPSATIVIQKPPTAQNYAIGCSGTVTGVGPYSGPVGFIEGSNKSGLHPASLYLAQLADRISTPTSIAVSNHEGEVTQDFRLMQNFPNPFNPETTIQFYLPQRQVVRMTIIDIFGREIQQLLHRDLNAGYHNVLWDASLYPSGVYLCRIDVQRTTYVQKLLLTK